MDAGQREGRSVALFVALLLHIPLVLLLLALQHDPADTVWHLLLDEETLQKMSDQEREEWVATRMASGAPIVLQSPSQPAPEQKQLEQEAKEEEAVAEAESEQLEKEEVPEPKKIVEEVRVDETKPVPITIAQQEPKPVENPQPEPPKRVEKKEPVSEKTPQTVLQQQQPQPNLTLAQLAQGFVQHLQDAQEGEMNMEGKRSGHPSEDQMRRGRYAQKVLQCVIESYHRNRYRAPRVEQQGDIAVAVVINQDGSLGVCKLVQPSGSYEIDQFVQALFKDAGSSFPPVPKSFKEPAFPVRFNIPSIHAFASTSHWTYG